MPSFALILIINQKPVFLREADCFLPLCVNLLQLHPELSALPEQHDSGGLHDGAGCSLPAGD